MDNLKYLAGDVQDVGGGHEVRQLHELRIEVIGVLVSFRAAAHLAHRQQRPCAALGHPGVPHHLCQRDALPRVLQRTVVPSLGTALQNLSLWQQYTVLTHQRSSET